MAHVVIGTAGHIDHGKTSLVKALTGVDTDRLEEERRRGMTIDLGFAFLTDHISITDVPGHEKFIRNMVAGVSTIHMALIVIAADDGVMPQTVEHLQILELLGIRDGIVALTKVDAVRDPEWIDLVEEEVNDLLVKTSFGDCPVVRTSVMTGQGIETLRKEIMKMTDSLKMISDRGTFRLPVDRVFSKSGFGTVVTGTVIGGWSKTGDTLMLYPSGRKVKVRGLQSHGNNVGEIRAGDRAALNLSGVDTQMIYRGCELAEPDALLISDKWIVHIKLLTNARWKLKNGQKVHVHVGTSESLAVISGLERQLLPGEQASMVLTLNTHAPATPDDRLIIRSYSPVITIGGGKILFISSDLPRKVLTRMALDLPHELDSRIKWLIHYYSKNPKSLDEWSKLLNQKQAMIEDFIHQFGFQITDQEQLVYIDKNLNEHKKLILSTVKQFYKNNPYHDTMNLEQLKDAAGLSTRWFEFCLQELLDDGTLERTGGGVALMGYRVELTSEDEKWVTRIIDVLERSDLEPVPYKVLINNFVIKEDYLNSILYYLKNDGRILNISDNTWISMNALERILKKLRSFFKKAGVIGVSEFKDLTGLTRKSAIPWLEFLDRRKFTERNKEGRLPGAMLE